MEKINIAELLKDCPKGMELDCTMFDNVSFIGLQDSSFPIIIHTPDGCKFLTPFGCYHDSCRAKCIIFPKGKTTWEGFKPPCKFKDGDICCIKIGNRKIGYYENIVIFKSINEDNYIKRYVNLHCNSLLIDDSTVCKINDVKEFRFATEEEKEKLFHAIKANGYKWNTETKTLEKLIMPKFKVGDIITNGKTFIAIGYIDNEYYYEINRDIAHRLCIKNQDEWELVPNKFNVNTLKTFDQVLVRLTNNCVWMPKLFSHYDPKVKYYPFITLDNMGYPQCIPYKGNEHLSRTTDNCNEFYKIW